MRLLLGLLALPLLLPAASQRGVEILWDRYGVAHVYAKDTAGMFFGYGYAQMQSHGDLILKLYGESRGRAAEYWGEKNLDLDRWVRLNDIPERGLAWYKQQTPEFRKYLDAFADGMNEYARLHPDKLNPERRRALPITGADAVIHTHRIVHFSYMSSRAKVAEAVTGRGAAMGGIGSNAWAIAPAKSASGKTMMVMNPHLPWQDWYTYYEIHLNGPGMNFYGASQAGFPVLRFVFTDHLGFTQTVNSLDGSDLYQLTPAEGGYRFDGAIKQFETEEKTISVRQADGSLRTEKLVVKRSVHGPVVFEKNGYVLAQRTAALDRPFMLEQYWKMATAKNFAQYQEQVRRLQVPTFNITYGDKDGHVMYLFNGTLPKRSKGDLKYWAGVVPGDTSETLWTSVHSYDEIPKVIDPPSGWVQNTNDPPWTATLPLALDPAKFPLYTSDITYSLRTARSLRMLAESGKLSFEKMQELKMSTRVELADRILDDLIAAATEFGTERAKKAAAVLKAWDREANGESRGALLFDAFARKLMGNLLDNRQNFAVGLDRTQPLTTPRGLKDPKAAAAMLDGAAGEAESRYGALDAPWGEFRRVKSGGQDFPASGADGQLGVFRVLLFDSRQAKPAAFMGDTFVACVEFANPPRAKVLLSYGNSSQPGSPHAGDQVGMVSKKEMRTAWRSRKDVEANLESRDRF